VGVPFCTARLGLGDRARSYKDSDLVLLSRVDPFPEVAPAEEEDGEDGAPGGNDDDDAPPGFTAVDGAADGEPGAASGDAGVHALALVEQVEADSLLRVRLFLPTAAQPGRTRSSDAARYEAVRAACASHGTAPMWYLSRLCNLATIQREWVALHHAATLPFMDVILSGAQRSDAATVAWKCPPALRGELATRFNPTQLEAIHTGLSTCPVVLIQGPPGTGKTATLQGLLSLVMHAQPAGVSSAGPQDQARDAAALAAQHLNAQQRSSLWRAASPWMAGGGGGGGAMAGVTNLFGPLGPPPAPPIPLGRPAARQPHVLVCAPSNSALDEIVGRLMRDGLLDAQGKTYAPSLVRVGVHPHPSVKSVTMDALVEQRLSTRSTAAGRGALAATPGPGGDGTTVTKGGSGGASFGPSERVERDRLRLAIMDECSVVASTLSFSGSGLFTRTSGTFDVVIIDEAAQAVEPSVLVPLLRGCRQLFLVGDPVQLPATVLSTTAKDHGYDTSLFSRLQRAGHPVHVLKTQYRMHPQIRAFPSAEFYEEALVDGPNVLEATSRHWHAHAGLGAFTFWDVPGTESLAPGSMSFINTAEAAFVVSLAQAYIAAAPELVARSDGLAVVTPYKAQARLIRELLARALGDDMAGRVDVNTIDGFQGREREVVLFSVVRSPKLSAKEQKAAEKAAQLRKRFHRVQAARLGFVEDERRMNVGLTRARASLAVIGRADALAGDGHWGSLVQDAYSRGRFVRPTQPYEACIAQLRELAPDAPLQAPSDDGEEEAGGAHRAGDAAGHAQRRRGRPQARPDVEIGDLHPDELSGGEDDGGDLVRVAAPRGRGKERAGPPAAARPAGGTVQWAKRPRGDSAAGEPEASKAAAEPPASLASERPKRSRAK
jgi:senataxin